MVYYECDAIDSGQKSFVFNVFKKGAIGMLKITQVSCLIALLSFSNLIQPKAFAAGDISEGSIDPVVVQEKIQLLGLRDDTVPSNQQPHYWLKERRLRILPELIAGLDNPEKRIAEGCLKVLTGVTDSKELYRALVRIAADRSHPINKEATLALCAFPLDKKARTILQEALSDTQRFEDLRDRATIALALGLKAQAVEMFVEYIKTCHDESYKLEPVRRLGDIGHDSAIGFLEEIAEAPEWYLAVEAYLAMDKIDPVKHGLTEVQKAFLIDSRKQGKWTQEAQREWWKGLAKYDKNETRPFVMQMLHSDHADTSLVILQAWKDKNALPEIKRMIEKDEFVRPWHFRVFMVAYLDIEGTEASIKDVTSILKDAQEKKRYNPLTDKVRFFVMELAQSEIGKERKIEILKGIKTAIVPLPLARSMGYLDVNDESAFIILSMMLEEKDIAALGTYAKAAIRQNNENFIPEISRSLGILTSQDSLNSEQIAPAQFILDACVVYNIENAGKQVNKMLESDWPLGVKLSAASVCAGLEGNRAKGLMVLYGALKHENVEFRKQASGYLMTIPCRDENERIERENVLLSCIGQPCEDYSLCLLTTCAGPKSTKVLQALLDEEDVSRAVYAGWVLAQNADEQISQKGLRRVAIYALFNHQVYQAGSGIDFQIAHDLSFHQVTGRLNPGTYKERPAPVTIPDDLLKPFTWDEKEQAFSIRAYRSMLWKSHFSHPLNFLRVYRFPQRPRMIEPLDETFLPLMAVVVQEDPEIRIKFKQGNPIACFPNRQAAAKIISNITGEKTTYPGLAGELLESDQIPEKPYDNQNQRIAESVLDQIQEADIVTGPASQKGWDRREALRYWIRDLTEKAGTELKETILAESQRREIAEDLEKERFSIWIKRN